MFQRPQIEKTAYVFVSVLRCWGQKDKRLRVLCVTAQLFMSHRWEAERLVHVSKMPLLMRCRHQLKAQISMYRESSDAVLQDLGEQALGSAEILSTGDLFKYVDSINTADVAAVSLLQVLGWACPCFAPAALHAAAKHSMRFWIFIVIYWSSPRSSCVVRCYTLCSSDRDNAWNTLDLQLHHQQHKLAESSSICNDWFGHYCWHETWWLVWP